MGRPPAAPLVPRPEREPSSRDGPFGRSVPLGHWCGVAVRAHWSVLAALVLFAVILADVNLPATHPGAGGATYWIAGAVTAPLLFVTLLAHELAHALTARRFRLPVKRITLWLLGGLTEVEGQAPGPRADALVAAAGPLTSLALGGLLAVAARAAHDAGVVGACLGWLATVNVLLGVFNLLPGAPLDGGRLVRALLWWRGHDRAAAAARAARLGRAIGAVLVGLGLLQTLAGGAAGLWTMLVGWFILQGAAVERDAGQAEAMAAQLAGLTVRDVMSPTPLVLPDDLTVADVLTRLTSEAVHQDIFPVVDREGRLTGAITVPVLASVAHDRVSVARVRDLTGHRQVPTTTPAEPLDAVALPLHLHGGLAVVVDHDRPVGVISDADLARAATPAPDGPRPPSD